MNQDQLLIGIIIAVAGNAFVQFLRLMKTPKDVNDELAEQVAAIRETQGTFAEQGARHDEILKHLITAINRLTDRIDKLEPMIRQPNGRTRGG